MTKIVRHALAIIILLCLPAAGCGPGQAGLSVKVHLPPAGKLPAGLRGEQPPGKGEFPAGITDFRLCVSAADMAKPRCDQFNKADYLSQGKARLGGIPAGSNRKVTFQGYDFKETSDEKVVWCGEVSGVEINKDATTQVEMFVTACSNFTLTRGDLERARAFHTATRLPDGRVLVAGGFNVALGGQFCPDGDCLRLSATDSIEIYDPRQGTFSSPPGAALSVPRALHTATLLPDGRVLVAGGCQEALWYTTFNLARTPIEVASDGWGSAGATADIITVSGDSVSVRTVSGAMSSSRALHRALALPDGDVLLLGGIGIGNQPLNSLTRFVTAQDTFEDQAVPLQSARQAFTMLPLEGQGEETRRLLWGGNHPAQAGAGNFAETVSVSGDGSLETALPAFVTGQASRGLPVFGAAGAVYDGQQVLLTGGMLTDTSLHPNITRPEVLRLFRVIDFSSGDPTITRPLDDQNTMRYFRALHTASLLQRPMDVGDPAERILVAGGLTASGAVGLDFEPQNTAEFFLTWESNDANSFVTSQIDSVTVQMNEPRAGHSASELDANSDALRFRKCSLSRVHLPILIPLPTTTRS